MILLVLLLIHKHASIRSYKYVVYRTVYIDNKSSLVIKVAGYYRADILVFGIKTSCPLDRTYVDNMSSLWPLKCSPWGKSVTTYTAPGSSLERQC